MSTEGDSAKSALSDANDKSGTDNHTDTSQDSADVPVIKEKTEKQPEIPAENDVETKNAVEKDEEKPEIEEKESAPESEELGNQKDDGDLNKPNKEKPFNDNESDDVKKEEPNEDDKKENDEDEITEEKKKPEKKPEVKEAQEKEKTKKKEAVASDKEEEEGEDDEEEEPEDEEEEDEEEEEGDEEVVEEKKVPAKRGRKEKKKSVPLLDQPLETTGKRERKNVQRFTEPVDAKEPAKVEVESGSGTALGEIPRIDASISRFKNDDLKLLYKLLFKQVGKNTVIKKQIRKFNGFAFAKDSEEYKKRVASASKLDIKHLKSICEMLDLTKTGTKDDIIGRILEFLLEPKDSGKPLAGGRPKRASAVRANNRGYSSHDDFSSDEKHSSRARRDKGKRTNLKDDTSSDEEFRPDNVSDGSDDKPKALNKRKRGRQKTKKAASSEEEEGSLSELSSEESDEEPQSKRRRSVKANNKTKAKATPRGRRGRPKATAATTPRRAGRPKRSRDTSEDDQDESDQKDEGSSSEDEPLAKKKTKNSEPPTDDEIKTFIKSILEGANLEEITMKTVCQRVYANYPEFDLSHKKDFIKTTVKSLIST